MPLSPPPVGTAVDNLPQASISQSWLRWFNTLYNFIKLAVTDYSAATVIVPLTGFSQAMVAPVLVIDPAGTLATGTVVLPASPSDGQAVQISSSQVITSFTLSPAGGETVKAAPTSLSAGQGVEYFYRASNTTWYRLI